MPQATLVRVTAGGGARGQVKGRLVEVGKLSWLAACGVNLPPATAIDTTCTVVGIAIDGQFAGTRPRGILFDDFGEKLDVARSIAPRDISNGRDESCGDTEGNREHRRIAGEFSLARLNQKAPPLSLNGGDDRVEPNVASLAQCINSLLQSSSDREVSWDVTSPFHRAELCCKIVRGDTIRILIQERRR